MLKRPFSAILTAVGMVFSLTLPSLAKGERSHIKTAELQLSETVQIMFKQKWMKNPLEKLLPLHPVHHVFNNMGDLDAALLKGPGIYKHQKQGAPESVYNVIIGIEGTQIANGKRCVSGYITEDSNPIPEKMFTCVWEEKYLAGELAWILPHQDDANPMQILAREPTTALAHAEILEDDQKIP